MAFKCCVCGKGPRTGKTVSHSHRGTKRRFLPNLQHVKILVGGTPQREYVCTTCLKSNRIHKA